MYKERLYINNRNWVELDTEEWELKHIDLVNRALVEMLSSQYLTDN